ncbi:hypothetical protein OIU85_005914 [Salix viminalis]|uniref:Uncharacterized protein n=1 Tax=Salix viminalis TaxID=40686 RepID=A0A9Q0STX5_SALVM|nr:hypothetical protein OIU85_005914 [Salix viminalis]
MYPSNQDTAHEMNQKPPSTLAPPATGFPVGPSTNQHHNENNFHPAQHHHQQQLPGRWSSGLCGCFSDIPNCCITCWCPCITFGQIAEIVDKGTTSCAISGAIYGILSMEYRELKHRGFDMAIGWQGNLERQNGGATMIASAPPIEEGMKR